MFLFCGCTLFDTAQQTPATDISKQIVVPVGKNWEVKEEPPNLTNELHMTRPAFQTEQSLQPEGMKNPVPTGEKRKIEPPH